MQDNWPFYLTLKRLEDRKDLANRSAMIDREIALEMSEEIDRIELQTELILNILPNN